jgi:tetratricopeptide (TPR) repeat protein
MFNKISRSGALPQLSLEPQRDVMLEAHNRLAEAEQLRLKGSLDKALSICDTLLSKHPNYVGALHTAGLICGDKRETQRAMSYLTRAVMLCPDNWSVLTALGSVYLQIGAREIAAKTLRQAAELSPDNSSIKAALAMAYHEEREYERAAEVYRDILARDGDFAAAAIGLARACVELGWHEEATRVLETLVRKGERGVRVLHVLARIPSSFHTIDIGSLAEEAKRTPSDLSGEFERTFAYLLAIVHSRKGNHAEAWKQLLRANKLSLATKEAERNQNAQRQKAALSHIAANKSRYAGRIADKSNHPLSVFVLGPSRSGKTTVEKLIAALEGVKLGYENPIADNAVRRTLQMAGFLASGSYMELPAALEATCRQKYLDELSRRTAGAQIFTNTDPSRIYDVPRIASIIPNARFVYVKRDPRDVALRIFMTMYRSGNAYAYDLGSIFEHVAWYYDMIDAMAALFPQISTVIRYEDTVENPAAALKTLSELCGSKPTKGPLPDLGDDRGCSVPYHQYMQDFIGTVSIA